MDVLVTGFEPFGGEELNPSWEVCRNLRETIGTIRIHVQQVPCEFRTAANVVVQAIESLEPSIILSLGQAGGQSAITVERVAINVDDSLFNDNAGVSPVDEPVASDGPAAYFATVPVKAMVTAMLDAKVPALISNTAGTFVCNHLMYGVLHHLASSGRSSRAGFIHVPWLESQTLVRPSEPSMALATMVLGVEMAIAAAVGERRENMGTIST